MHIHGAGAREHSRQFWRRRAAAATAAAEAAEKRRHHSFPRGFSQAPSQAFSQAPSQGASGPALVNSAFGINFGGVKRRRPEDNHDPVRDHIERLKTIRSQGDFLKAIWPRDLFKGMDSDKGVYKYVQSELDKIHKDGRNHREISQDPSFTTSMVAPVPLNKAARQIALKNGTVSYTHLTLPTILRV